MYGREGDILRLATMLTDDRPGVVTVTGPGGVGKSTLLAAVCRHLDSSIDDSVLIAGRTERSTGSGPEWPAPEGGTATAPEWPPPDGMASPPEWPEPEGSRASARNDTVPARQPPCPPRCRLLIVDPADEMAQALAELSPSLPPDIRIVACAIRPLGLPGERTVSLGPLPTADPDEAPEVIAGNPAVQLFRTAAVPAQPAGRPAPDDLAAIASVCRLLGGWPLAIEHAASFTQVLTPRALSEMLAGQPELAFEPAASPGDATRLLPSLRAAFARAWRRLSAPERSMLRAATVFAGPFGVRQVAAVAARPVADALRTLTGLLQLGLVHRVSPHDERFAITPPVRQYARWTFGRTTPERPIRQRYVEMVCETAHASALASSAGDELAAMRAIDEVDAELVPVLDHLVAADETADALQLAADLAPGLVQSGSFDVVAERLDALLRRGDVVPGPALAGALVGYADIVFTGVDGADRDDLAAERLQQGVRMLRAGSDAHALMRALSVMIRAWPVMRDPRVVASCAREGATIARETGSPAWLARFEAWSGMLAHQTGDLASAVALGSAALARGRRCGDLRARLLAGLLLHTVPEPPEVPGGLPGPENLVRLAEELREPRLGSIVLAYRAQSSLQAGRTAEASYWCARALETGGRLDTPFGAGFAIMFLVGVACARGETAQAVTLHGMVAPRLEQLAAELPPRMAAAYTELTSGLRASLGTAAFDVHARAGARLAWRDATARALAYAYRAGDPGNEPDGPGPRPVPGSGSAAPAGWAPGGSELPHQATRARDAPAVDTLTPREQQVLELIAEGLDTRVIADRLRVSVNSVSHHTSNLLSKLGVQNRTQAAIWAVHRRYTLVP